MRLYHELFNQINGQSIEDIDINIDINSEDIEEPNIPQYVGIDVESGDNVILLQQNSVNSDSATGYENVGSNLTYVGEQLPLIKSSIKFKLDRDEDTKSLLKWNDQKGFNFIYGEEETMWIIAMKKGDDKLLYIINIDELPNDDYLLFTQKNDGDEDEFAIPPTQKTEGGDDKVYRLEWK